MQKAIRQAVNVFLVLATILVIIPERAFATGDALKGGDEENSISLMSGTHYIRTVEDLVNINDDLSGTYYLQNDLDLSHYGNWTPIGQTRGETSGDDANVFTGVFDGEGHSITGLTISGLKRRSGLFDVISGGGIVRNLHIEGNVSADADTVGILAGYLRNGTISNVFTSGSVRGTVNIGGIVGACGYWGTSLITNCYTTVDVERTVNNGGSVGCGGAVGILQHGAKIENCYATGRITASNRLGGIVGLIWNNSSVIHCYYSNINSGGGEYKSDADMKHQSTYQGWDFSTVWAIDASINNGYPYLRSVSPQQKPTSVTVTFNSNGGIGSMEAMTCMKGNSVWLPANTFYRVGYTFAGWNTRADGSGTAYRSQAQITPTDNITCTRSGLVRLLLNRNHMRLRKEKSSKSQPQFLM